MLQLKLKTTTTTFPEAIAELTPAQWQDLAEAYLLYQQESLTYKAMAVRLVYRFLDLRRSIDATKEDNNTVLQNVAKLAAYIDNLFETHKGHKKIKLNFTENPLPTVIQNKKTYKGPTVLVSGLNFGNYVTAINAFNDYSAHLEDADLHSLITALYPGIDASQTTPIDQFIIYIFFATTQQFLANAHSLDIGGGNVVNIAQLFKASGKKANTDSNFGMAGALYEIAKEGTFGNAAAVKETETWDVLVRMAQLHETAIKIKRDAKNNRPKHAKRAS